MKADGIIFDLDGTLWDSCKNVTDSWKQTLTRMTGSTLGLTGETVRGMMGLSLPQIAQQFFPNRDDALILVRQCASDEAKYLALHGGDIYPGVREMIESLSAAMPLFIVSNCSFGYIESFLDYHELRGYITEFLHPDMTGLSKAGNIRLLREKYSLGKCVYVGDTHMDRDAALEAGCAFIHAAYGFESALQWGQRIEKPSELLSVLEYDILKPRRI